MSKEEYKEEYENLEYDFWSCDMNGKVTRLNELIDGGCTTDGMEKLDAFIRKWNLRCCKLLYVYDSFMDKIGLESSEKYNIV